MVTDIYKRDPETAEPVKMGSVRFDGTDVTFQGLSGGMRESLQKITVGGETFTPLDGAKYIEKLPYHLRGDYLWASKVRN